MKLRVWSRSWSRLHVKISLSTRLNQHNDKFYQASSSSTIWGWMQFEWGWWRMVSSVCRRSKIHCDQINCRQLWVALDAYVQKIEHQDYVVKDAWISAASCRRGTPLRIPTIQWVIKEDVHAIKSYWTSYIIISNVFRIQERFRDEACSTS